MLHFMSERELMVAITNLALILEAFSLDPITGTMMPGRQEFRIPVQHDHESRITKTEQEDQIGHAISTEMPGNTLVGIRGEPVPIQENNLPIVQRRDYFLFEELHSGGHEKQHLTEGDDGKLLIEESAPDPLAGRGTARLPK